MARLHGTFKDPDEACVHLISRVFTLHNRVKCLQHDKNKLGEQLDQLKKTHKRTLAQKRHFEDKAEDREETAKKIKRELTDALVPGYQRARDDDYMRKLLERHSKRLKQFNLTPEEYAAIDAAEQETLANQQTAGPSRPVTDAEPSTSVHRRESQQLAGTGLPMPETPERKKRELSPAPVPETQDDQRIDDISALDITSLPLLCDNCNAAIKPVLAETMETGDDTSCNQVALSDSATQQTVTAMARDDELPPDAEPWESGEWEPAPEAVCPRGGKTNRRPRDTWLNFTEKYVKKHYMAHLIGHSNLRYRGKSFAEHCHHRTIDWDNHAFCPACYILYDLPKCSKYGANSCDFCAMNSDEVDAQRSLALGKAKKPVASANRDLPLNCYTQADCDAYAQANGYYEVPNPQWLEQTGLIVGCIPATLIPENVHPSVYRQYVNAQVSWFNQKRYKEYCEELNKAASKGSKHSTPSTKSHPLVPKGLRWDYAAAGSAKPTSSSTCSAPMEEKVLASVTRIEEMLEYMYGPLKHAEKVVSGESSTLAAAVVKATSSSTSTQAQAELPQPLGLSVLSQPPPALAALMQANPQPQAVAVRATRTTVETIRSCTPTAFKVTLQDFTCQFGPITENKVVQTDEHWVTRRFVDTARVQPQRVYEQKNMKFGPWQGSAESQLPDAYPLWLKQHDLTKRVGDMERYGNEAVEIKRRLTDSTAVVTTKQLVIGNAIPDAFDRAMTTAASSPYNITVQLPGKLGSQNTDEALLQGRDMVNLPDQAGFYPTATDVVPMTQHEARQHRVIAQMNAHTTGWEAAVTQKLRGKLTVVDQVEDLRDEVTDTLDFLLQRQRDRVQLSAAHMTLATLIPRRDLMIRCGLLPEKNLLIFTNTEAGVSPLPHPKAEGIVEDEVARQQLDPDTTREVLRRHFDVMYRDEKPLSVKGREQRDDYLLREQQMREDRAKLLETQLMDQTVRRHTGSRMFESAVKLRESQINEKLRLEREALLRQELAKLRNRPVEEFHQLKVDALVQKLQEAKAALKQQQAQGAQRQKTVIVRELPDEVKQEPDDRNMSQQVARKSPAPVSPRVRQPSPPPAEKQVRWHEDKEMRVKVVKQLARTRKDFDKGFFLEAAKVADSVTRLNKQMAQVETDDDRQQFLTKVVRVMKYARERLLDDDHRRAFDCVLLPARTWVLNLNTPNDQSKHLKTVLLLATTMFFSYYVTWYKDSKAPKLVNKITIQPEDLDTWKGGLRKIADKVTPKAVETQGAPATSSSAVSDEQQQKDAALRKDKVPVRTTARMSTSTRPPENPPYVYVDRADDPAFE